MKNAIPSPSSTTASPVITAEPLHRRNAVALLREADAALEIIHLDPASCEHLSLRHIATVRELLTRLAMRIDDIQGSLFGDQ